MHGIEQSIRIPDGTVGTVANLTLRAAEASATLHGAYGSPQHDNKDDPLDELVFIIISQMTTHHSFGRVFDRLKALFPDWEAVRRLSVDELGAVIKDAGLSNQKAPRIISILERVHEDFGHTSLDVLSTLSNDEAERYLTSLPGVGTKTAKCVLMYSLGRQVLPVDTHLWRIAKRLALVDSRVPYHRVHEALEAVVAPGDRYSLHVNAIVHGRTICQAKRPKCGSCVLRQSCPNGTRLRSQVEP